MASLVPVLVVALGLMGAASASELTVAAQIVNVTLPSNGCVTSTHDLHGNTNYIVVFQGIDYPQDGLLCTPSDVLVSRMLLTEKTCFRNESTHSGGNCAEYYTADMPSCVAVSR